MRGCFNDNAGIAVLPHILLCEHAKWYILHKVEAAWIKPVMTAVEIDVQFVSDVP